jgi:hypothetical protein
MGDPVSPSIDPGSLDYTSSPALSQAISEQSGSSADLGRQYSLGASQARGLLTNAPDSNSGLSYGNRAVSDAIKSRTMGGFNRSMNELNLNTMKAAQSDHLRNLQVATNAATQEVEQNKQKAVLRWKIDQANKAARGQIVGTTLGIVGGVAGAVFGGPAGAMAGYAVGSGVGNAVGSANG